MDEAGQRQAEDGIVGLARHGGGNGSDAVVGVHAGDDLAPLGVALGRTEEPERLDHGVIRLGPRIGVEHPAAREGRDLDQLLAEHHGLVGHAPEEGVVAREAVILRLRGLGEARVVEARDHVPEARVAVEVLAPVHVVDIGALAMGEHDRAAAMHGGQVGEAVEREGIGPAFPGIRGLVAHGCLLLGFASSYPGAGAGSIAAPGRRGREGGVAPRAFRAPPGYLRRTEGGKGQIPRRSRIAYQVIAVASRGQRSAGPPGKLRWGRPASRSNPAASPRTASAISRPASVAIATPWPE